MIKDNFYPRLNFGLLEEKYTDFDKSKFVILPVPYDATATFKVGARDGPAAIIEASQWVELYDHELNLETYQAGIHSLPEVIPALGSAEEMVARLYKITKDLLKTQKTIITLGGDHSVSIGVIKAFLEYHKGLSVLQLDAHSDLRDEYEGSKFSSATSMRRVVEMGGNLTQVGIRATSLEEVKFAKKNHINQFFADSGAGFNIDQIINSLGDRVYVSIDVDCFDPSIMSATGTPEPGGLGWYEVVSLLKKVAQEKKIVGFDVVELSPDLGSHSCCFLAARLIYKLMGYLLLK